MSPKRNPVPLPKRLAEKLRAQRVRLYAEQGRVFIMWRPARGALRQYQSYPDTPEGRAEARAFAEGKADALATPQAGDAPRAATVGELWERYVAATWTDEAPAAATKTNYRNHWRQWQAFTTPGFFADQTTLEMVDRFRAEQARAGIAVNQIRQCLRVVKLVYGWGRSRKVLRVNELPAYRFTLAKGERPLEPPEFRSEEWERVLREMGGRTALTWRAWVVTLLAGSQGARARAVLHLRVEDVDLAAARIRWAQAFDKNRRERWQPLTWDGLSAVLTALAWRASSGYAGPWLIPGRGSEPYRYQSWWYHFDEACRRAGVARTKYQGAHAFRKMAAGNVLALTGDPKLALDWIGDTDPRRMREYLKVRDERLRDVADRLGAAPKVPSDCHAAASNEVEKLEEAVSGGEAEVAEGSGEPLVGLEPTTARRQTPTDSAENPATGAVSGRLTRPRKGRKP